MFALFRFQKHRFRCVATFNVRGIERPVSVFSRSISLHAVQPPSVHVTPTTLTASFDARLECRHDFRDEANFSWTHESAQIVTGKDFEM